MFNIFTTVKQIAESTILIAVSILVVVIVWFVIRILQQNKEIER